jgi:hypothetical protein
VFVDGSGDAPAIQAGIDSAAAEDTVWTQPGIFRENLDFLGKAIVVRGSGIGVTTLDGQGLGSCVVFQSGESRSSVLEDLTILNRGDGPDSTWGGGGIAISSSPDVIVERNIVAYSSYGGGIRCDGPSASLIRNNLAWQNVGGDGVGACPDWWQSDGNLVDNPYFCNPEGGDFTVAVNSPAMTHPAAPLGAYSLPGCGRVSVQSLTWGRLKSLYR